MSKPSYDELDQAYRAALRREVQQRKLIDELHRRLLREQGRHMQGAQEIATDLVRILRDDRAATLEAEVDAAKLQMTQDPSRPVLPARQHVTDRNR